MVPAAASGSMPPAHDWVLLLRFHTSFVPWTSHGDAGEEPVAFFPSVLTFCRSVIFTQEGAHPVRAWLPEFPKTDVPQAPCE